MAIAPSDIGDAFRRIGIGRGDVVMLHSDAIVLAQLGNMPKARSYGLLFEQLDEVLGDQGTLVLPTFTYSATRDEVFDPASTPSTVGALPEYFRALPGVLRSRDPIFSIAARGKLAAEFSAAGASDCFGPESAFALLARHDAWLACLGCPFMVTYVHHVEQNRGVPYRYFKEFQGRIAVTGGVAPAPIRYYVRNLGSGTIADLTRLSARMKAAGTLTTELVGRMPLHATRTGSFAAAANALLDEDSHGLIQEGVHE